MDSIDSRIPLNPDGYCDTGEHAYQLRTFTDYSSMLFRDSTKDWLALQPSTMIPDNPMEWSMRHWQELICSKTFIMIELRQNLCSNPFGLLNKLSRYTL